MPRPCRHNREVKGDDRCDRDPSEAIEGGNVVLERGGGRSRPHTRLSGEHSPSSVETLQDECVDARIGKSPGRVSGRTTATANGRHSLAADLARALPRVLAAQRVAPWEWAVTVTALFLLGRSPVLFARQRLANVFGGRTGPLWQEDLVVQATFAVVIIVMLALAARRARASALMRQPLPRARRYGVVVDELVDRTGSHVATFVAFCRHRGRWLVRRRQVLASRAGLLGRESRIRRGAHHRHRILRVVPARHEDERGAERVVGCLRQPESARAGDVCRPPRVRLSRRQDPATVVVPLFGVRDGVHPARYPGTYGTCRARCRAGRPHVRTSPQASSGTTH